MPQKKQYTVTIDAAPNIVWHALWSDEFYTKWTAAFMDGSQARSDWKEGSEILFLDGRGSGMYSMIDKLEEPKHIAFRHVGEIKDGVRQTAAAWNGAIEAYTLVAHGKVTEVIAKWTSRRTLLSIWRRRFPRLSRF